MALEVDFITLGDASKKIDVNSATLRHWTDQLEEFDTHYVMRNNRNERIYYESDIEIFRVLKKLRDEYKRRTTARDLSYILEDKAEEGELELRKKEDAPQPSTPSNKTADLLNQEDIKRLMESERVKQFIGIIIAENTKAMRAELIKEVREEVRLEMQESNSRLQETIEKNSNLIEESVKESRASRIKREESEKKLDEEAKKGFFARLFGS